MRTLRTTVNVVSALGAIGLVVFISYYSSARVRERRAAQAVAAGVDKFRKVLAFRAAANETQTNGRGWPVTVDPEWFSGDPPRNVLVTPDRPWVEIATVAEAPLHDPPVRMTIDNRVASFWYNPYQGVVRARVPVSISDQKSLDLYNQINGTSLDSIYGASLDHAEVDGAAGASGATGTSGATSPATASVSEDKDNLDPTVPKPAASGNPKK
jgi:hypothetical protein